MIQQLTGCDPFSGIKVQHFLEHVHEHHQINHFPNIIDMVHMIDKAELKHEQTFVSRICTLQSPDVNETALLKSLYFMYDSDLKNVLAVRFFCIYYVFPNLVQRSASNAIHLQVAASYYKIILDLSGQKQLRTLK